MEIESALSLLVDLAWVLSLSTYITSVVACASDGLDAVHRCTRCLRKHHVKCVALLFTGVSSAWIGIGVVASIASFPLILGLQKLARDQHTHELYLAHVVYPSVRKALHTKYGSATAADYREYLNEKLIENFWKPEVDDDLRPSRNLDLNMVAEPLFDELHGSLCAYPPRR